MKRQSVRWSAWVSALGMLLAVAAPAGYSAAAPVTPLAHQHSWVLDRATGQAYRVANNDRVGNYAATAPTGLSPAAVKAAYNFPTSSTAGAGKTIAIVDAYDDPTAESDLNVFSQQYGLPPCTTANGCFQKVDQNGGTSYPRTDAGWALEISLDIQWAHAIAPGAKILLVEAKTNSFTNLLAAEDYARTHAQYVSNSWGGTEFSGENTYDSHFVQSGVSFFVSSGDNGTPAEYPSASPNVVSVGGTTLTLTKAGAFSSETGWSGSGGGCSLYETATGSQSGFSQYGQVNCAGKRATPDLSLVADPATGVSIYDSTRYQGQQGWFTIGGTSASSPMIAARAAVAGVVVNSAYVYGSSIAYRDITSGNNGASCLVGLDLVTGRGSWTN
jgi:subtilase family serine protease